MAIAHLSFLFVAKRSPVVAKTFRIALPLACCVWIVASTTTLVSAQEGGFSLNPFNRSGTDESEEAPQATGAISDEPTSSFSLPTLPKPSLPKLPKLRFPTWGGTAQGEPSRPSTWDKFNRGAKSFFAKTKKTLMPWTVDEWEDRPARSAARSRPTQRSAARSTRKPNGKNLFSSLFDSPEEEKEIETVNDFLSLPQVPYE
jgi:hypothetical protein